MSALIWDALELWSEEELIEEPEDEAYQLLRSSPVQIQPDHHASSPFQPRAYLAVAKPTTFVFLSSTAGMIVHSIIIILQGNSRCSLQKVGITLARSRSHDIY